MFRNKKQKTNHYGTFHIPRSRSKKIIYVLIALILAGAVGLIWRNHKPVKHEAIAQVFDPIPGWWYKQYFGASVCEKDICKADADPDRDDLTNAQEFYYHTDPLKAHTMGDKLTDGQLVARGFDPSRTGRITFDQLLNSDSIIEKESLALDKDATKIFSELISLKNVQVPEVNDSELKISKDNSKKAMDSYFNRLDTAVTKYFPQSISNLIGESMQSADSARVESLKVRALKTLAELKSLEVPSNALQLHKQYVAMFSLIPFVVDIPPKAALENQTSKEGNLWFDRTQSFMYLMQQSGIEMKKLQAQYRW